MELSSRSVFVIAGAVAVFVVGVVAGRSLAPDAPAPTASGDHDPAASSTEGNSNIPSPERFARTRTGAVEAATAYGLAVDGPALLDPDRRAALLADIAAATARNELQQTLDAGADFIVSNLALSPDHLDDPGFVWRVIPGGWRIQSYDGTHATVAIWATGLAVMDGRPLAEPGWRTTEIELVWERDDWRLASFRSEPGPAPSLAGDAVDPTVGARINAFVPYRSTVAATAEGGPR